VKYQEIENLNPNSGSTVDHQILLYALKSRCHPSIIQLLLSSQFDIDTSALSALINSGYSDEEEQEIGIKM
jgi:hypothetical protein